MADFIAKCLLKIGQVQTTYFVVSGELYPVVLLQPKSFSYACHYNVMTLMRYLHWACNRGRKLVTKSQKLGVSKKYLCQLIRQTERSIGSFYRFLEVLLLESHQGLQSCQGCQPMCMIHRVFRLKIYDQSRLFPVLPEARANHELP